MIKNNYSFIKKKIKNFFKEINKLKMFKKQKKI